MTTVARDVAVFTAGAVAAVGITFAICRWLFGDLRLLP